MAILNYTTTVDAYKTVAEIEHILVKHKALLKQILCVLGVLFIVGGTFAVQDAVRAALGFVTLYVWMTGCEFLSYCLKYKCFEKRIEEYRVERDKKIVDAFCCCISCGNCMLKEKCNALYGDNKTEGMCVKMWSEWLNENEDVSCMPKPIRENAAKRREE